ncbi:undecaprenyl/decaprenyl-phosphate alpha-N-acetylglucosaminyl 1-phosphate transferase [Metallumcola ferriviriculae]|uniref:Undecaprenyl/decaprenyl-phosphate alpha-N-acetylglucosaminyl 1-phosphate transferase n=1 Tax=Metallumcola ferriviriculae TaxID=3039180 RepID=A0AAU0UIZ4_9FIRM|nr:undecaprenyl/decaprenyl-phosphate alpha-N-acetylglucosaminyl 1-phosphate transferase [Desulfitibacteraceae bacterium MK1]
MYLILAALAVAFIIVYVLTPHLIKVAGRVGAMDSPDDRKVHQQAMPRIGGLAIFIGFVSAVLLFIPLTGEIKALLVGGAVVLLFGVVDDIKGISPKVKLFGQIAAAIIVTMGGIRVDFITNPFDGMILLGKLAVPVTVFWIVGVTNALNLIDGLDGLAAGTSAIAAVTISLVAAVQGQTAVAVMALVLAVSIMGFLKYNFHPAQIFMGDSGSMFLGFTLASMAVMGLTKGATVISLFIPIVVLGIPIFDTFFAIVRRYLQGKPIFQADKGHLHHRLLDMGFSHKQTVLAIYGVNLTLGGSGVLLSLVTTEQSLWILLAISVLAVIGANKVVVAGKRSLPDHSFRQTEKF